MARGSSFSPRPLESIGKMCARFADWPTRSGEKPLFGAGTVLDKHEVEAVMVAGGRLIVSPHTDASLIAHAKARGALCLPGVLTPSEAFAALAAGADALKLFPAQALNWEAVAALRAVLPPVRLILVGGVTARTITEWKTRPALVDGWGVGAPLFTPDMPLDELRQRARSFVAAAYGKSSDN